MIGSNTLIIKKGNEYFVYIYGGFPEKYNHQDITEFITEKDRFKPEAVFADEKGVYLILRSTNCIGPMEKFYSRFAGDGVSLYDFDNQRYIDKDAFVQSFRINHPEIEETIEKERLSLIESQKVKALKNWAELEREILTIMETRQSPPENPNYNYDLHRATWDVFSFYGEKEKRAKISFFEGHGNKIPGMYFIDWFLSRRFNLRRTAKRYDDDKQLEIFEHKGVKWCCQTGYARGLYSADGFYLYYGQ